MKLTESIKKHEGFVNHVYKDSLGLDTLGYGTLMPITKQEGEILLQHRLNNMIQSLVTSEPFYNELPQDKADIIAEMAYQMGVSGVLEFKNMWNALKKRDYQAASFHMIQSKWAEQTPNRAKELSERMKA